MQLLIVQADGEVHEIKSEEKIRDLLDPTKSYILNDDRKRIIYLWKGSKCSVRLKFIGANKSQEVRGQVGLHYKVVPIDEGDEPADFLEKINEPPTSGIAKEIREEKELQFEVASTSAADDQPSAPKLKPKFGSGTKREMPSIPSAGGGGVSMGQNASQGGPLYTGESMASQSSQQATPSLDFKTIMETLESLEIPEGYEREMVIIGNGAYSIIEKKVKFLGTEKVEKVMEKVGSLPEGVFFADGYAPRVLCENQQVLAIEFLKRTNHEAHGEKKLKPKSKDPKELAKSFGLTS